MMRRDAPEFQKPWVPDRAAPLDISQLADTILDDELYRGMMVEHIERPIGFQKPWVPDRAAPLGISQLADTILDDELYREMMAEHIERRIRTHIS